MDWALFRAVSNSSFNTERILSRHYTPVEIQPGGLRVQTSLKPGAFVKSIGRTSGYQVGQISTTASRIFHEDYITEEWCIIKRPQTLLEDWIQGGIGVQGDSGGLIVDEESDEVYGMLWGRSGDGPATVTLFTPMHDLMEDIRERVAMRHVSFIHGQEMPRPSDALVAQEISPSPSIQLDEIIEDISLDLPSFTLDSASEYEHRHRWERYRGPDFSSRGPGLSVPRQEQRLEQRVESGQWPGTHTYMRYALADEED